MAWHAMTLHGNTLQPLTFHCMTFHHIIIHCLPLLHIYCTYASHIFHRQFTDNSQTIHTCFTYTSHTLHIHFPYTSHTLHMHCTFMFDSTSHHFTFHCCALHYITLTSPWHHLTSHAWAEERVNRKKKTELCTFMLPEVTNTYSSPFSPICMQGWVLPALLPACAIPQSLPARLSWITPW